MRNLLRRSLISCLLLGVLAPGAWAWGPHPTITKAALDVLPEMERWKADLGEGNIAALTSYCWLPDQRGQDLGSFYADDYLLIHAFPRHAGHVMPEVRETYEPYYRRALQALRTETPANALRQLGPLLHFVEDSGAPPHAKEKCPKHSELENWVRADQIAIAGYQPRLLGRTDDEALKGLLERLAGLVVFSAERAERALPLVNEPEPDRAKVEPIILESALESARVTADMLYTVFTVGLAPQPEGARLEGTVTAGEIPLRNDHGARIVLLDTDYATLATTAAPKPEGVGWSGRYEFHHLPDGTYRVLAYRTGSRSVLSAPVTLRKGQTTRLDLALPAVDPAGNIIENPDGRLSYLPGVVVDRWRSRARKEGGLTWSCAVAWVKPKVTYRCGAVLKDPEARVRFVFQAAPGKKDVPTVTLDLPAGEKTPAEQTTETHEGHWGVTVTVESAKPLPDAIERVWVVPVAEP